MHNLADQYREERKPPWDEKSEVWKLQRHLDIFQESLPPRFKLNASNTDSHLGGNALTVYTAIHSLYSLCIIVLHREYIPFIPLNLERPSGPIDAPLVPNDPQMPIGWWDQSASRIFKSARDIADLVRAASYRERLVQSPPIALAIFTSAFCGIYSYHFPQIDTGRIMMEDGHTSNLAINGEGHMRGATGLTVSTLKDMSSRMRMAYGWTKTIKNLLAFFNNVKDRFNNQNPQGSEDESSAAAALRSLRSGGGALDSYKEIEKELKDFGTLDDDERMSPMNDNQSMRASTRDPSMPPHVKREMGSDRPPTRDYDHRGAWAAVNDDHIQRSTSQFYDFSPRERDAANTLAQGSYYQHSRAPASNQPPLLSPPNSSLNPSNMSSPYTTQSSDTYRNGNNYVTTQTGSSSDNVKFGPVNLTTGLDRATHFQPEKYSNLRMSGDLGLFGEGSSLPWIPTTGVYIDGTALEPQMDNYVHSVNFWHQMSFAN